MPTTALVPVQLFTGGSFEKFCEEHAAAVKFSAARLPAVGEKLTSRIPYFRHTPGKGNTRIAEPGDPLYVVEYDVEHGWLYCLCKRTKTGTDLFYVAGADIVQPKKKGQLG